MGSITVAVFTLLTMFSIQTRDSLVTRQLLKSLDYSYTKATNIFDTNVDFCEFANCVSVLKNMTKWIFFFRK